MGKTRALRKYRRKTKRVKTHVKPFSKKSRKRSTKHKKNKRTVKRRLGVKNRKSRRIIRRGGTDDPPSATTDETPSATTDETQSTAPRYTWARPLHSLKLMAADTGRLALKPFGEDTVKRLLPKKVDVEQAEARKLLLMAEKFKNDKKIILTKLFTDYNIEIFNGETLLNILTRLYKEILENKSFYVATGLTGAKSYMPSEVHSSDILNMIDEIKKSLSNSEYGDRKIKLRIDHDNQSSIREHVANLISNIDYDINIMGLLEEIS